MHYIPLVALRLRVLMYRVKLERLIFVTLRTSRIQTLYVVLINTTRSKQHCNLVLYINIVKFYLIVYVQRWLILRTLQNTLINGVGRLTRNEKKQIENHPVIIN